MNYWKKQNLWLTIPALVIFVWAVATFIVATFFDYQIAETFSRFFDHPLGNFISYWSSNTGFLAVFIPLIICLSVLLESLWLSQKYQKKDNWLKRNEWVIYLIYALFLAAYIGVSIYQIVTIPTKDFGMGPGVWVRFLDTYHESWIFRIVFFLINLFLYSGIVVFMRRKFGRDKRFLIDAHWIVALKILVFAGMIYLSVIILKVLFGRPFYFSTVFESEMLPRLEKVPGFHQQPWSLWEQLPYHPWYQPFEIGQHLKAIFTFHYNENHYNNAFPSGHVASCQILLALVFFGYRRPKNRCRRWMILFSYLIWIQILIVTFGMVIYRFHWMTDMTFTLALGIVYFFWIDFIFEKQLTRPLEKLKMFFNTRIQ